MPALPTLSSRHAFFALAALAVLMGSIDGTIVAVALPQLKVALDTPLSWIGWTLTSYQLVQIVMYPLAGRLSDSLGRKRVFLFCLITFTVASLACGMAPNVGWLIVFRAIQAIGGGGLQPSAVGIIADQFRHRRAQAIGLISSFMPMGSIIGPNLGGFLLQNFTWRALFWINVPLGLAAMIGVYFLLPARGANEERTPLSVDAIGLAQYTLAIVTLMYGMTVIADDPAQGLNPLVWGLFVASVTLIVLFLRHVKRTPNPIMEFDLLVKNPFLAANLYNFFFGAVVMGFFSFVPYYAVVKYGLSPFESGAVLTPRAAVVVSVSILGAIFINKLGYRLPMLLGMFLVACTLVTLAQGWNSLQIGGFTLQGFWLLAAILAIGGAGNGLSNPASNNASIDLAPHKAAAITGIRGTFRLTGGAIAIAAIVLALSFFPDQADGLAKIYIVLAATLVLTVPMVLMIPDMAGRRGRVASVETPYTPDGVLTDDVVIGEADEPREPAIHG